MKVLLYDEGNAKRTSNNQKLISTIVPDNIELVVCDKCKDFPPKKGAESIILDGEPFDMFFVVQMSIHYEKITDALELVKEVNGTKDFSDIVVIGSNAFYDESKLIAAPDGYLQEHHIPKLKEILNGRY